MKFCAATRGVGLLDLRVFDGDVRSLGFLNLQRFVDEIAQHLKPQPFSLLIADLAFVGGKDQRQALVDIGAGDHVAIDDRRRPPDVGIVLPEHDHVLGNGDRARGSGRDVGFRPDFRPDLWIAGFDNLRVGGEG